MNADMSFVHLITQASVLVQLVMLILMGASIVSWAMIFKKVMLLKSVSRADDQFEDRFWSGGDLAEMYSRAGARGQGASGMERIFLAGYKEFSRIRRQDGVDHDIIMQATHRAMRVAMAREVDELETHLPFLATVGSTSPYVGLFGTVWGIMNSFRALGAMKQATLSTVAPGIAEALIATAMGLFAAIPAVVSYNRFSSQLDRISGRYENFVEEFLSIVQRQIHTAAAA